MRGLSQYMIAAMLLASSVARAQSPTDRLCVRFECSTGVDSMTVDSVTNPELTLNLNRTSPHYECECSRFLRIPTDISVTLSSECRQAVTQGLEKSVKDVLAEIRKENAQRESRIIAELQKAHAEQLNVLKDILKAVTARRQEAPVAQPATPGPSSGR